MRIADLMNNTLAYRAWQAPFAESKLRPLLSRIDLARVHRVLDVGCGPGTNARHFANVDYTGLDINEGYIADARRRHGRDFRVADVTRLPTGTIAPADLVLVNSLLHHLDDDETHRVLSSLAPLVMPDGLVHILDLVLPEGFSIPRAMAKLDRGRFARKTDEWHRIFQLHFIEEIFEPYSHASIWSMVYFRGSVRR